jgi:hypothetical protein
MRGTQRLRKDMKRKNTVHAKLMRYTPWMPRQRSSTQP